MKLSTIQTGVSGEYFVAAELSRHGYVASLTLRNTRELTSSHPIAMPPRV